MVPSPAFTMVGTESLLRCFYFHLDFQNRFGNICIRLGERRHTEILYLSPAEPTTKHKLKTVIYAVFNTILCLQTFTEAATNPISLTLQCSLYCTLFNGWLVENVRFSRRAELACESFNLFLSYEKDHRICKLYHQMNVHIPQITL